MIYRRVEIFKSNLNDRERLLFLMDLIDQYNPKIRILKLEEIRQLYSTIMSQDCTIKRGNNISQVSYSVLHYARLFIAERCCWVYIFGY